MYSRPFHPLCSDQPGVVKKAVRNGLHTVYAEHPRYADFESLSQDCTVLFNMRLGLISTKLKDCVKTVQVCFLEFNGFKLKAVLVKSLL